MKVKAGVWIDHRKALIVLMTADGERAVLIVSHVEKHLQRSGDSPLRGRYEAQQVPADDCRENALTAQSRPPERRIARPDRAGTRCKMSGVWVSRTPPAAHQLPDPQWLRQRIRKLQLMCNTAQSAFSRGDSLPLSS